jgi:hypothetical protein
MKKIIFVLMLIATLIISGCGGGDTSTTTSSGNPYVGGTSSVNIKFEEGAPPNEVYAGNQYPFEIIVDLDNNGEYDINKNELEVKLIGIEPTLFGKSAGDLTKKSTEDLYGAKKDSEGNTIAGSQTIIEFANLKYITDLDAAITDLPIKADVCFKYVNKARGQICIKKDVLDTKKSDICTINEDKTVDNSGGPIQITNIKETALGQSKIAFSFTVKQVGTDGSVYRHDTNLCTEDREHENKVHLKLTAEQLAMSCTGLTLDAGSSTSGLVNLGINGERIVRCVVDVSQIATDYEKSIGFEMTYDYKKHASTTLTIRPNE